ncbi:DUF6344 domain-containing protein [Streptomyces sp. MST-110588]|uniref:DUF6344 domain-containing protein n=1 Tax=Streptomyces sp. MST-110588 TaxID=2833628 RepID=UPI001F5E195B|nr:DUF6344 domain-containing protein [Streptomyces sp. MST-110588]UNO41112.1 hypothetical protein KGS77_17885 [Streptomyces sp. MST-110588]
MTTTAATAGFWSALLAAFLKVLAYLGFKAPASALAPTPATPTPAAPSSASTAGPAPAPGAAPAAGSASRPVPPDSGAACLLPHPRCATPAGPAARSLPPTMKQRIQAEAHNAAPATRSLLTSESPRSFPTVAALHGESALCPS